MNRSGKLLCGAALFCTLVASAAAQIRVAPPAGTLSDRYQRAEKDLNDARNNAAGLLAEQDRLTDEQLQLSQKLVESATRVQELEQATGQTAAEVDRLADESSRSQQELVRDRVALTQTLAIMQRLRLDEKAGRWNAPGSALRARRAELQAGGVLKVLYGTAAVLDKRLNQLANLRRTAVEKDTRTRQEQQALMQARDDLDRLIEEKRARQASLSGAVEDMKKVTGQIGHEAEGLKSLIDRIAALRASNLTGNQPKIRTVGPANGTAGALSRGSLHPPVPGKPIPGDPAGPGVTPGVTGPSGLWYEVSGKTEAIAPGDSEVVFAGTYQKLGQVLILELAGGYDLALAGLGRIDVHVGDLLLAGEPVGTLPEGKAAPLYLELRRNGKVVDPAPWMSADIGKAKGT